MRRALTVAANAICAMALVAFAGTACGGDESSGGGDESSTTETTSASAAPSTTPAAPSTTRAAASTTPTIAASSSPTSSGGVGSATITVDGADVAINGPVECGQEYTGFVIQAGSDLGSAWVVLDDTPEASKVRITDTGGAEYFWQAHATGLDEGEVKVTKSGTTYTITGEIPFTGSGPSAPSPAPDIPKGTLTPFEIEAICP